VVENFGFAISDFGFVQSIDDISNKTNPKSEIANPKYL